MISSKFDMNITEQLRRLALPAAALILLSIPGAFAQETVKPAGDLTSEDEIKQYARESRLRDRCDDIPRHTHIDLTVRTRTTTSGAKQHVASADGDKLLDAKGGLHDMLSRDHPSLQDRRAGS